MIADACKANLALFAIFFIATIVGDVDRRSSTCCRRLIALCRFSIWRTVLGVLVTEFVEDEQGSEGGAGLITPNPSSTSSGLNGKMPVALKAAFDIAVTQRVRTSSSVDPKEVVHINVVLAITSQHLYPSTIALLDRTEAGNI